jgi:hypothetical protein
MSTEGEVVVSTMTDDASNSASLLNRGDVAAGTGAMSRNCDGTKEWTWPTAKRGTKSRKVMVRVLCKYEI